MRERQRKKRTAEIRLDRTQALWATSGVVVALAAMFALGLVVGKRAAVLEQGALEEPASLAELDAVQQSHRELTFYEKLTQTRELAPEPEPQPEAAPKTPAPVPAAAAAVAPTPAPKKKEPPAERRLGAEPGPAQRGEFTVQVSSFQTSEEADAHASSLRRKGYRPFVVAATIPGKGTWYRVRLGRFQSVEEAKAAKRELAFADIPAWVLKTQ